MQECLIEAAAQEAAPTCDVGEPLFVGETLESSGEIVYELGPLEPGTYYFQDDAHPQANGALIIS